ncbi:MAG: hypothetical protein S4CHLAM45_03470 [Chlamydiales bacterium]|nr:hypothetical protein [Chlamydiales bacterium]MCH9619202.1 hypothetical protein [Chlamydiales bacterium]MCH9622464.1 hypothetical protein [Chlamydiales bacterium]
MKTSEISFLSGGEKLTLRAYQQTQKYSIVASEVIGRLAAVVLLSPAAALDLVFHTLLGLSTFVYAIGASIYKREVDFTLPWQHLQRVRSAVAPLLLGSVFGALHPFAGLAMSEATDKHAVIGMLSSNTKQHLETPCSPIHSLSIVKAIAKKRRYCELGEEKKEIFSIEHIKILKEAKYLESYLEVLQSQEFIHKITNVTLFVMAEIKAAIENSCLSDLSKAALIRISGLLVPILTVVDITITLLAQVFFLVTGVVRLISGRGPIYTEVTINPLMHASFLIQNVLKAVGNLAGMFVWFVSPMTGFEVSHVPANLFFKLQVNLLMLQIKRKMNASKNQERFVVPVIFGNGDCTALSFPTHAMHKTYLIIEKEGAGSFNLYWVNRPEISHKMGLSTGETLKQIRSMLDERFPFMDTEKLMGYPVQSKEPEFLGSANFATIKKQGGDTNCVVSNMFGMLEALDLIDKKGSTVTNLRYQAVRKLLMERYAFYKKDFFPFKSDGYSLKEVWSAIEQHQNEPV